VSICVKISVGLVTRNRPDSLERTLKSLSDQSFQPFEVIISDDSSEQLYQEKNRDIAKKFNCRYLQGPARGLYANRNFVALACTGTHIRTMDDDHEFPPDHFKIVCEWVEKYSNDVLVIGEVSPNNSVVEKPYPIPGQLHPRGFSEPPKNIEKYFGISCGGTVYPKKIFDLGYRCCEDFLFGLAYLEFGSLLKFKGIKIRLISETYLIHYFEHADLRRDEIIIPSMLFAMICHAWYYQPSKKNKTLCIIQIIKIFLQRREKFIGDFLHAISAAKVRLNYVGHLPALCE
jgi:glycosyltransferase involved in cell wall biosynthesis